jgi:hypothetical protein
MEPDDRLSDFVAVRPRLHGRNTLLLNPQVDLTLVALLVAAARTYGVRREASSLWLLVASLLTLTLGLAAALNAAAQMIIVAVSHYSNNIPYDFSVYSVMLIGLVTILLGSKLINVSGCIARGDRQAWKQSARYTIALLVVVTPMGPFEPMAYAAVAVGFVSLASLEMARSVLSASPKACAQPVPHRRATLREVRA